MLTQASEMASRYAALVAWILLANTPLTSALTSAQAQDLDVPPKSDFDYSVEERNAYLCTKDGVSRSVSVDYLKTPGQAPCGVVYEKFAPEAAGAETLWFANQDAGYCAANALGLVHKLRGFGWRCGHAIDLTPHKPLND